jgi:hypothetical protein
MFKRSRTLATAAMLTALALPAAAQTYTETLTGTVQSNSTDTGNLFGGGTLTAGEAVSITTVYSLTNGALIYNDAPYSDEVEGGTDASSTPNPVLSLSVTIGTSTYVLSSADFAAFGLVTICSARCGNGYVQTTDGAADGDYVNFVVFTNNLTADLTAIQSSAVTNAGSTFDVGGDFIQFDLSSVSFNAPVPEPTTLAALGTGLIALGLVRRRRA